MRPWLNWIESLGRMSREQRVLGFAACVSLGAIVIDVGFPVDAIAQQARRATALVVVLALIFLLTTWLVTMWLNREIGRRRALEERLASLEVIDELTGLANRRQFNGIAEREWRSAIRDGDALATLIIDIDNFDAYNARYGRAQGDVALRLVASAITAALRRSSDVAARVGGEEFVALLCGTDPDDARTVCENVHRNVASLCIAHERSPGGLLSVSIGVAGVSHATSELMFEELLKRADVALYRAKTSGRNKTCAWPERNAPSDANDEVADVTVI
jgi:diguanylate cyclase (GGDEF)-like protein